MSRDSGVGIGDSQKPAPAAMPAFPARIRTATGAALSARAALFRIPNPQFRIPALNP